MSTTRISPWLTFLLCVAGCGNDVPQTQCERAAVVAASTWSCAADDWSEVTFEVAEQGETCRIVSSIEMCRSPGQGLERCSFGDGQWTLNDGLLTLSIGLSLVECDRTTR